MPLSGVAVCNDVERHFGLYAAYLSHSRQALQVTQNTAMGMLFSGGNGSAFR